MFSVMCCGCHCFMGKEGERIFPSGTAADEPSIVLDGRLIRIPRPRTVAEFRTYEEAQTALKVAGWSVDSKPKEGRREFEEDHRCPQCAAEEAAERARVGHHPGRLAAQGTGAIIYRDRWGIRKV